MPIPLRVEGLTLYPQAELERILLPCVSTLINESAQDRLSRCAALLSSRLVADGYINTRVFPQLEPAPGGTLQVVEGRIAEVRVSSPDRALQRRLQRLVLPLQGQVLHLPSLERTLTLVEQLPGISSLSTSLNRLGGDSTKAVLELQAQSASRPLAGDFSLRNDGSTGSGQFRGFGVLAKGGLLRHSDQLLLVGELNGTDAPQLGYRSVSLSYRLPFSERASLTTAAAASWRQLVESPEPFNDLNFRQQQLFGQLDYTLHEGLRQRFSAYAGLSANRNSAWLDGERFPAILGGADTGALSTGFLQMGLAWEAALSTLNLNGRVYGLQGLAGFSGDQALQELAFFGINVGEARALGGELNALWPFAPSWQLQLRGAAQVAFEPLTNPMGFSLGSDNGLRGLPGQVISGDNGWLASGELSWAFWRKGAHELQLVPFLGAGWVSTTLQGTTDSSSLGAGGLLLRWLHGRHWAVELGWASQFGDNLVVADTNLLVDNGLYTKMSYRF
jgi:hemolysin activation/secretion protein